jgi:hypothetical protein
MRTAAPVLVLALVALAAPAASVTLRPGDLLAYSYGPGAPKIYRIDPATGEGAPIPSLEPLHDVTDIAVAPNGEILFTEVVLNLPRRIAALNPETGAIRTVSQFVLNDPQHLLYVPIDVIAAPDGRIFASGSYAPGPGSSVTANGVFEIDPQTGTQTLVNGSDWQRDLNARWFGGDSLVLEPGGAISFLGAWRENIPASSTTAGFARAVVRLESETGTPSLVSMLGPATFPTALVLESDATFLTLLSGSVFGPGSIVRVSRSDGTRQTLVTGGDSPWGTGMALLADGDVAVSYADGIERIDLETGARSLLFSKPFLAESFTDLAVVPVPEAATAALVAGGLAGMTAQARRRERTMMRRRITA